MKENNNKTVRKINSKRYHPDNHIHKEELMKELNIEHNNVQYQTYQFDQEEYIIHYPYTADECYLQHPKQVNWLNVNGLITEAVKIIGKQYAIHKLQVDDILSTGQRAKMDDFQNDQLFVLLPMLRMNNGQIEKEDISIVLTQNQVLTFQQEALKDPFNPIRQNIKISDSPLRLKSQTDFLFYNILDVIVDEYFTVLDNLNDNIQLIEDIIMKDKVKKTDLENLNQYKKEVIFTKRNITPVRDIINNLHNQHNNLINANNRKYFKDISDHVNIAIEYTEYYIDWIRNLQDTYTSQVNMKTNEVMKILTLVTTMLAPITILGTIYGMNFDNMPLTNNSIGFHIIVLIALGMSVFMLYLFKRKRWL